MHYLPLIGNMGSKRSTLLLVLEEIIQYYKHRKSSAYLLMLDASKAFDRANCVKLFHLLIDGGLCMFVVRTLVFTYVHQLVSEKWGNSQFSVSNGVKQGGVLSPLLFSIYIYNLFVLLKYSGLGCHLGSTFVGGIWICR